MAKEPLKVIGGVDTHADTHHVAVIMDTGLHLADREFPAAASGYRRVVDFLTGFGEVVTVGVEGTGSDNVALAMLGAAVSAAAVILIIWRNKTRDRAS